MTEIVITCSPGNYSLTGKTVSLMVQKGRIKYQGQKVYNRHSVRG